MCGQLWHIIDIIISNTMVLAVLSITLTLCCLGKIASFFARNLFVTYALKSCLLQENSKKTVIL